MIADLQFQALNSPIIDLARYAMPEEDLSVSLDLGPEYQRASVWTLDQRRNLIKSLLQGLPIGAVFVNEREYPEAWPVIDGKQRIETIVMWLRDDFSVPRDWFRDEDVLPDSDDGGEVTWSDLSVRGQRVCANRWQIAQYRTRIPASAEPELYARINYGGTPHEPIA